MSRPDTETHCHCTVEYHGSDHCPVCGCEQYETGDCGVTYGGPCAWLIEVASGNPEPDFPEDLYRIIECGGVTTVNEHGSWKCEYGHEHVSCADPARGAFEAEMAFAERHNDY